MKRRNYLRIPQPLMIQIPGLVTGAFLASMPGKDRPPVDRPFDWPTTAVLVNGTELRYAEAGKGEPVVMVHGSLGDYRTWGYQIEPFSRQFRTIAYSRRWHYPNDPPPRGITSYSSALHARDLAQLLRELGCWPAHLVGNSMGAVICLQLAIDEPELVASMTLCEPGFVPWLGRLPGGGEIWSRFERDYVLPAKKAIASGDVDLAIRMFCDGVLPGWWDRLAPSVVSVILENAAEFVAEMDASDWMTPFGYEAVERLRVPILLLKAAGTPELFDVLEQQFAKLLPNVERRTAYESCHAIHAATPDFFNQETMDFIKRVSSRG